MRQENVLVVLHYTCENCRADGIAFGRLPATLNLKVPKAQQGRLKSRSHAFLESERNQKGLRLCW
jgi:hypothetical protein